MKTILKGEPLVRKLAVVSVYTFLPGTMLASLIYSPPDFARQWAHSPSKSTN